MKLLNRFLCIAITVYSTGIYCCAQSYWTLDKCINYAIENNVQIKVQELKAKTEKKDLDQSKFDLLPNISASASHSFLFQNSLNPNSYQYESNIQQGSANIRSSLTIFNGFQQWNTIARNKFNYWASLAGVVKAKIDMTVNVTSLYLQVLFCIESLDIAKSQLDVSIQQVEKLKKFLKVGNITQGDLLDTEAQAARDNLSVSNAENKLQLATLDLVQLLDLDSIDDFKVTPPVNFDISNETIISSSNLLSNNDIVQMPQIRNAEFLLRSSEYDLRIAKGRLFPTISVSGTLSSRYQVDAKHVDKTYYPIQNQLKDKIGEDVSISMSIPVFSRFENYKNISVAKIKVKENQYNLIQKKKELYKEIQRTITETNGALGKYKLNQEVVFASEEAFKSTQHKFNIEMISYIDYSIAKNNLLKAKSDFLQAKYEYIFKVKILNYYKSLF